MLREEGDASDAGRARLKAQRFVFTCDAAQRVYGEADGGGGFAQSIESERRYRFGGAQEDRAEDGEVGAFAFGKARVGDIMRDLSNVAARCSYYIFVCRKQPNWDDRSRLAMSRPLSDHINGQPPPDAARLHGS